MSSSSPNFYESEPKVVCVAVQTPNKLLKSLVASKAEKGAKPTKEHDAQIAAQAKKDAEKEFKQFAEKVIKLSMILLILHKYIMTLIRIIFEFKHI